MTAIMIAPLTDRHVRGAYACEKECLPGEHWSESSICDLLTRNDAIYFVAVSDGEVVGTAGAFAVVDELQITNICVLPSHRRMGIAKKLLCALFAEGKKRDCKNVYLEVACDNTGAIALYNCTGFCEIGRRKNYYKNSVDAILMAADV